MIRRDRMNVVAFRFQFLFHFLNSSVELLILAPEFFNRIVIDNDIGIDSMTFDDPFLAILRIGCELRPEELSAIGEREWFANSDNAAPSAFADQFTKSECFEAVREDVSIRGGELINKSDHRAEESVAWVGTRCRVARHSDHNGCASQSLDDEG